MKRLLSIIEMYATAEPILFAQDFTRLYYFVCPSCIHKTEAHFFNAYVVYALEWNDTAEGRPVAERSCGRCSSPLFPHRYIQLFPISTTRQP